MEKAQGGVLANAVARLLFRSGVQETLATSCLIGSHLFPPRSSSPLKRISMSRRPLCGSYCHLGAIFLSLSIINRSTVTICMIYLSYHVMLTRAGLITSFFASLVVLARGWLIYLPSEVDSYVLLFSSPSRNICFEFSYSLQTWLGTPTLVQTF